MRKKIIGLLKALIALMIIPNPAILISSTTFEEPIIVDHTCAELSKVPYILIKKAKSKFRIFYGHTSHGSQIISGMEVLSAKSDLFSFNRKGKNGALSFYSQRRWGDLGNPDQFAWYFKTRKLLNKRNNDLNLVIWSWCGQLSHATEIDVNIYLNLMNKLENDFPLVIFVYMTGHLDGTGEDGNLNIRNNQIRKYCVENKKVLYDFADIESYDPDGNYFLDKGAEGGCYYLENGIQKNWAEEWCNAHPEECSLCSCAHTNSLNCDLKGRAFWWLLGKLAEELSK
jgi:hypothetical protein